MWLDRAANYAAINAPSGISEWGPTGLTQTPSTKVKAPRVAESAFSIEARLLHHHDWNSPSTGKKTGTLCIVQGGTSTPFRIARFKLIWLTFSARPRNQLPRP